MILNMFSLTNMIQNSRYSNLYTSHTIVYNYILFHQFYFLSEVICERKYYFFALKRNINCNVEADELSDPDSLVLLDGIDEDSTASVEVIQGIYIYIYIYIHIEYNIYTTLKKNACVAF